jgi:pilus assembly protein CpaC
VKRFSLGAVTVLSLIGTGFGQQRPAGTSPVRTSPSANSASPATVPADRTINLREAAQATIPTKQLRLTVGKSLILDSIGQIVRVSVANPDLAETVAINPHELLINGKLPGETTLIIWQEGGDRRAFELKVEASSNKLEAVRAQIAQELPGQNISVSFENDNVFVRGTAKDMTAASRAVTIASTMGKTVNLLKVDVPGIEPQILLKVRFANVDRSTTQSLGINIFSTGATNTVGSISTGQYTTPIVNGSSGGSSSSGKFSITDALNIFLFRNDINLGATIRALETKGMLEILAEPNLLAIDGKLATFLAGGEFPFPSVQGGSAAGAVSISFRKYGISIDFLPHVTPRGTIRLQVTPEVSSLDFANAVVIDGFNVPALATRRVQTEVELESGQSFAIAGMLDNTMSETLNKIPGLGAIPLLGKLFQSRTISKNNTELLVLVTPELVKAVPKDKAPQLELPRDFISNLRTEAPQTPGAEVSGPVATKPVVSTIPVEDLLEIQKQLRNNPTAPAMPTIQLVPFQMGPQTPGTSGTSSPVQNSTPAVTNPPNGNGFGL